MKRLFDVCAAGIALLLLTPLLLAIAVLLRIAAPGPVLFRSRRLGQHGRTFDMLKFRTMTPGSPDVRNPDGSTYSAAADPRVTRVGRWLRRTSLDELPQLWNVLRGEMSLVGPRPDLPDQVRYYAPADHRRLDVRPGITGLAQISGRNSLSWEERRRLDRQYVASRTFLVDLGILARTVPGVLRSTGVFVTPDDETCDESRHG
jgi:lipopolysaccharide/colanic/teichoic acid biosynthesis glycosyltransferase